MNKLLLNLVPVTIFIAVPSASAQNDATFGDMPDTEQLAGPGDGPPWGLLGLLGLVGVVPLLSRIAKSSARSPGHDQ